MRNENPFAAVKIRYQRTMKASERTLQRRKKEDRARKSAAAQCRPLTAYFSCPAPSTGKSEESGSELKEESDSELEEEMPAELGTGPRDLAIQDLQKKLASKKIATALQGQNAIRHHAVLQFLYYQHRLEKEGTWNSETRLQVSQAIARCFNQGKWFAEKIVTWERTWITSRYIAEGRQGCFKKSKSWFNDEGVLLCKLSNKSWPAWV